MTDLNSRDAAIARMWRDKRPAADIAAQFDVKRIQVYRALRRTGDLPPYGTQTNVRVAHERVTVAPKAELIRVRREVCWRCGCNSDVGCRHMRDDYASA